MCSRCSPTRSSISCWRTSQTCSAGLRPSPSPRSCLLTGAFALVFFYAPNDADQGFVQKIFYLHVPMAIVALCGFVAGGDVAIQYLRTRRPQRDLRSYVAIHLSLILAVGVLITGSIWAKASWGHWWVWDEPTLVSFLIVFLLYACYQPLRFSIEDPERQARYASVFAIVAGAFVPLNFLAVRLAQALVHPRVLGTTGGDARRRCGSRSSSRCSAWRAVRDAVEVRDGLQARVDAAARAAPQARRRRGARPPGRAQRGPRRNPAGAAPTAHSHAGPPPRRSRQVRRRPVPRLPRGGGRACAVGCRGRACRVAAGAALRPAGRTCASSPASLRRSARSCMAACLEVISYFHSVTNSSTIPASATRKVRRMSPGRLPPVVPRTRGCV